MTCNDSKLGPETNSYALSGLRLIQAFEKGVITPENIAEKAALCFNLDLAETSGTMRNFINSTFVSKAQILLAALTPGREAESLETDLFSKIYEDYGRANESPDSVVERKIAFAIVTRETLMTQFAQQIALENEFLQGKRAIESSEEYQRGLLSSPARSSEDSSRDDSSSPEGDGVAVAGFAETGGTGIAAPTGHTAATYYASASASAASAVAAARK